MFPTEVLRTTSFRLALGASLILAASMAAVFALITWQAETFEHARVDKLIEQEARTLATERAAVIRWHVERHFDGSLRSLPITAIFDAAGRPTGGDVERYPADLPPDGHVHRTTVTLDGGRSLAVRAVAVRLPSGGVMLIGRGMRELRNLRSIVLRALALGFVPALSLSLAGGTLIGYRTLLRIRAMHVAMARIMAGGLGERLPFRSGSPDDLDLLAQSVNRMLDRLEGLVSEVRGVGDDIAHDLRTPLARVRATLDRARANGGDRASADAAIDRAIADLDRVFAVITALLRIAAIEMEQRTAGFADHSLLRIAEDALELYEPVADAKGIAIAIAPDSDTGFVHGDSDLLMEAVANLVDNAIKFTDPGGHVRLSVAPGEIAVSDDGVGLSEADRRSVLKRFYRADRSRHVSGNGLGLSLVAAIATLHGASVVIGSDGRGSRFALRFPPRARPSV